MGDGSVAHIGDDLHVRVRMRREAGMRRDLVVIPHADRAPAHALRVVVAAEREMMLGLEPTVVGAAKPFECSYLNHVFTSAPCSAPLHVTKMGCRIGE